MYPNEVPLPAHGPYSHSCCHSALGPVLGLLFVPMIGNASDQWSGRFGRRRPFIWALSLGVLFSLWLIPRSSHLGTLLAPGSRFLEVLLLVVGVSLMEFCAQACFTPLEGPALTNSSPARRRVARPSPSTPSWSASEAASVSSFLPSTGTPCPWHTTWVARRPSSTPCSASSSSSAC